ncbi:MAG: endonuclease III [Candidatus Tectomicrobia bacterium]|nr:endonuclease III [Candidatus Tectomicrobia bacterium]
MNDQDVDEVVRILREAVKQWEVPIVTHIAERKLENTPFKVLIGTLLSLRTKDETTSGASERLFKLAETPEAMLQLSQREIESAIYPVGFYKTKAGNILDISRELLENYRGRVPDEIDELLKLKGVGRKTANLVVTLGYGKLGICVDTHVHRISNRFGYVKTKTAHETEFALREKLPQKYWIEYNDLLVTFGQNLCKPISPFCGRCPLESYCEKVGVSKHR